MGLSLKEQINYPSDTSIRLIYYYWKSVCSWRLDTVKIQKLTNKLAVHRIKKLRGVQTREQCERTVTVDVVHANQPLTPSKGRLYIYRFKLITMTGSHKSKQTNLGSHREYHWQKKPMTRSAHIQ